MFKTMKKRIKNEKGLTLIELLAVVVILAIVAAIAVPAIGNIIDNSRYSAVKADATNALNGANIYFTDYPNGNTGDITGSGASTTITLQKLQDAGYLESMGGLNPAATISVSKPHKLTGTTNTNTKVNGQTIQFTNATIDVINSDTKKGKDITENNRTIAPPTTP
ncbi:type II secretion system protein [Ureibacillus chungkukjangi]|uniref:Type IV pilus assembly protein PilA n=1 Tax=Ureibacillus chungkukjangi TaxID=1202712 RepID=A0A318TE61_9BACL|nr:prepilin-type N-terminal cleavage/methylation domain-containing protein [Ureibacillus chungkukjangi]PYF02863.1 type IV pilus assembly protein PilA [Ureibacillus chungkukjangi]